MFPVRFFWSWTYLPSDGCIPKWVSSVWLYITVRVLVNVVNTSSWIWLTKSIREKVNIMNITLKGTENFIVARRLTRRQNWNKLRAPITVWKLLSGTQFPVNWPKRNNPPYQEIIPSLLQSLCTFCEPIDGKVQIRQHCSVICCV